MELRAEDVKNIRSLALCKDILRQAIELNDQLNEELRHQKYKRCLAISRYCRSVWSAIIFIHEGNGAARYMKWEHRWLKIAKQFKEAK